MIERNIWKELITQSWKKAPIVWLMGVRRSGKTILSKSFPDARYVNCDLPQNATLLQDPVTFYKSLSEPTVVFDEIHQLPDPSQILKIGADEFPKIRILATGSSSLAATKKFRDSLTGRKRSIQLTPILYEELNSFAVKDLSTRLFRGGLPPMLLSENDDPGFYAEWMDSYFARDIQELFHIEKRQGFLKLLELLLRQSGGLVEATSLARATELSRPTVLSYLEIYQVTHLIKLLRPFHSAGRQELLKQPRVYGFDTGFVRYAKGWGEIRPEDAGLLWEHLVLDQLQTHFPDRKIFYWRDKLQREVDFVIQGTNNEATAVECKWSIPNFEPRGLSAFRSLYPKGRNILMVPHIDAPFHRKFAGLDVHICDPKKIRDYV